MFLFRKKKDYDEKIKLAKYECIYQTLKDILRIEIKELSKDGADVTDYASTCSAMKTKARLAIDFVADLDKDGGERQKV